MWTQTTPTVIDQRLGKFESRPTFTAPLACGYEYCQEFPFAQEIELAVENSKQYPLKASHWITHGVLKNLTVDRYWAGIKQIPARPSPSNFILEGGSSEFSDLIS